MEKQPDPRNMKGLKVPTPIHMQRHGQRIYCSELIEEHQKGFIDALGTNIAIHMDGKPYNVRVRSVKDDKAILEVIQ